MCLICVKLPDLLQNAVEGLALLLICLPTHTSAATCPVCTVYTLGPVFSISVFRYHKVSFYSPNIDNVSFYGKYAD